MARKRFFSMRIDPVADYPHLRSIFNRLQHNERQHGSFVHRFGPTLKHSQPVADWTASLAGFPKAVSIPFELNPHSTQEDATREILQQIARLTARRTIEFERITAKQAKEF